MQNDQHGRASRSLTRFIFSASIHFRKQADESLLGSGSTRSSITAFVVRVWSGTGSMIRFLLPVTLIALILLDRSASADVKGIALVQVEDPKRGSIPETVVGYGVVESENTLTRSFQRDGRVANIMVEVGDQFKQ